MDGEAPKQQVVIIVVKIEIAICRRLITSNDYKKRVEPKRTADVL